MTALASTRRPLKPATPCAAANAALLSGMLPPGWRTRLDDFTCSILDPSGRCRRAIVAPMGREALADILVKLVLRFGMGSVDEAIGHIRSRCPSPGAS